MNLLSGALVNHETRATKGTSDFSKRKILRREGRLRETVAFRRLGQRCARLKGRIEAKPRFARSNRADLDLEHRAFCLSSLRSSPRSSRRNARPCSRARNGIPRRCRARLGRGLTERKVRKRLQRCDTFPRGEKGWTGRGGDIRKTSEGLTRMNLRGRTTYRETAAMRQALLCVTRRLNYEESS